MNKPLRSFAVVPAAGRSSRMGRHKLLLPWGNATVIESVLSRWQQSQVDRIVVVVRQNDLELIRICRQAGAEVVVPSRDPEQMKTSVQIALRHIEQQYAPCDSDAWLLAPADMPELSANVADRLLQVYSDCPAAILAPTYNDRRGHPVLFSWRVQREVHQLSAGEGVDSVLRRNEVYELQCPSIEIHQDLDTPADYDKACSRQTKRPR